ncbi:MAG: hypothetical protein Q9163_001001 [Psora crenata]
MDKSTIQYHSTVTTTDGQGQPLAGVSARPSSLADLPPEIRIQIYSHIFATKNDVVLRQQIELKTACYETFGRDAQPIHPASTEILCTNRGIYSEALPVFYSTCTFHHSINTVLPTDWLATHPGYARQQPIYLAQGFHCHPHLPLIRHLSLDYCTTLVHLVDGRPPVQPEFFNNLTKKLAGTLLLVNKECTRLRTLTVGLLYLARPMRPHRHIDMVRTAIEALALIVPRLRRLDLILFGSENFVDGELGDMKIWPTSNGVQWLKVGGSGGGSGSDHGWYRARLCMEQYEELKSVQKLYRMRYVPPQVYVYSTGAEVLNSSHEKEREIMSI